MGNECICFHYTVGSPYPWVPHPQIQETTDQGYLKNYIVADMYYVIRPMMVASEHVQTFLLLFLNNTV